MEVQPLTTLALYQLPIEKKLQIAVGKSQHDTNVITMIDYLITLPETQQKLREALHSLREDVRWPIQFYTEYSDLKENAITWRQALQAHFADTDEDFVPLIRDAQVGPIEEKPPTTQYYQYIEATRRNIEHGDGSDQEEHQNLGNKLERAQPMNTYLIGIISSPTTTFVNKDELDILIEFFKSDPQVWIDAFTRTLLLRRQYIRADAMKKGVAAANDAVVTKLQKSILKELENVIKDLVKKDTGTITLKDVQEAHDKIHKLRQLKLSISAKIRLNTFTATLQELERRQSFDAAARAAAAAADAAGEGGGAGDYGGPAAARPMLRIPWPQ